MFISLMGISSCDKTMQSGQSHGVTLGCLCGLISISISTFCSICHIKSKGHLPCNNDRAEA